MQRSSGFSLVELSVVLAVIALLLGLSLSVGASRLEAYRVAITKQRMEAILDAAEVYVYTHKRLPCPSDPISYTVDHKNFGWEVLDTAGNARDNESGSPFCNSNNIDIGNSDNARGAVPIKDLGLSPIMAIDGWDNLIQYVVDQKLTVTKEKGVYKNASCVDVSTATGPSGETTCPSVAYDHRNNFNSLRYADGIDIYNQFDNEGGLLNSIATTDVYVVLVSSGPNKSFAITSKGKFLSGGTADPPEGDDEYANYDVNLEDDFIQRSPTKIDGHPEMYFDDIVLYKTKIQLPRVDVP